MTHSKVMIVTAKCSHSQQSFGISFEEKSRGTWAANWAFPIKELAAKRESYNNSNITGNFELSPSYPGCPHCKGLSFGQCGSCGKILCWDGKLTTTTCPWCRVTARSIEGQLQSLSAGEDI